MAWFPRVSTPSCVARREILDLLCVSEQGSGNSYVGCSRLAEKWRCGRQVEERDSGQSECHVDEGRYQDDLMTIKLAGVWTE